MMKRLSKLTALLLAIALVLCAFAGAWADETEKKEAITREEYEAVLAAAMANFSKLAPEEQYKFLLSLNGDDELIESYLALLSEEQMTLLSAYIAEMEGYEVPKTVVFTNAGPFLPAVNVGRARMLRAAANGADDPTEDNGLILAKTATDNGDGTYKIRLEAYTTGEVISTTKTIPVDIVLVLDQSGSMAYDFDGNSTNTNADRRQYAMKQAVNNFIESVAEKYTDEADHRISIVTFGSSASTLQGWTYVDETGKTTLQGKISGLSDSPSGATNVAAGMSQADNLMGTGYVYNGKNTTRQKVVVVFTDGVPTTGTDFDTNVATGAISSAKNLKDDGATVYTVGIFNGANPNELYGASGFDTNSNGTIGSQWIKDTWGLFPGTDFPEADRPAGNRFLNYLSSNFPEAESIGLTRETEGWGILHYKITYKITNNFTRSASNYYLTANDSSSLNTIFKTIADNIQTANIDLGSETVIRDIVSESFEIPESTNEIIFYTAAAKADGSFDTPIQITDGSVTAEKTGEAGSQKVDVKGFNFNENFVSEEPKSDGTYGKKLIIEFVVQPREGFLGGNVATNGSESGVYDKDGKLVEKFDQPSVEVPIGDLTVRMPDKTLNVYLLGSVTATQLKGGMTVEIGGIELHLDQPNYGLEPWQAAGVDITSSVKVDNVLIDDGIDNITSDTDVKTYDLSVEVKSKSGVQDVQKNATGQGHINVFKPEVTFADEEGMYGDTIVANSFAPKTEPAVRWMNKDTLDTDEGVTMIGSRPTLSYGYAIANLADNTLTKQNAGVDVTVSIIKTVENGTQTTDVTNYVTFVHSACSTDGCSFDAAQNYEFLIHPKTCQLTITKTGGADGETYVFTVKKNGEVYTEVRITGNESVTIHELPIGTYTIEEDTGWSWRYTANNGSGVTLSKDNDRESITCANTANSKTQWLNGYSAAEVNTYGEVTSGD